MIRFNQEQATTGDAAIPPANVREVAFCWWGAILWNAIAQPTGFICLNALIKGEALAALGLLLPLVGLRLLWQALKKRRQMRDLGEIRLHMDPLPASIGGEAGGSIDLPVRYSADNVFLVSLRCERGIKRDDDTHMELMWDERGYATSMPAGVGTRIAFRFAVPANQLSSSNVNVWTVRITAELPGLELDRSFIIPVLRTGRPKRSQLTVPLACELKPPMDLPSRTVRIRRHPAGVQLLFPCRRNAKSALLSAFFSAWFLGGVVIIVVKNPGAEAVMLPLFGLIGGGLLLYSVWLSGNSLEVSAGAGELNVVRRFMGLSLPASRIAAVAVRRVEPVRSGACGTGPCARLLYRITAQCSDGTGITVGDGVEGRRAAEEVARQLREACGVLPTTAEEL
ncbi:hypothetical protein [Geomonas ferrireducens]|uniref:hypothetical protein n=1 Tax=Geomonas ferrireducens TaxID=2570227 RepID=UPI0010A8FBAB|nr:hypothetical protein [Geomonas ferrireducens]